MNDQLKEWWKIQKNGNWKGLVSPLKKDDEINSRFDKLLRTFYWRFREKKRIDNNNYPEVTFQGLEEFENHETRAGHCHFSAEKETKIFFANGKKVEEVKTNISLSIFINQWYLLGKLGMDKIIWSESQGVYNYSDVSINSLIKTIAHELAHAYQQTVNDFEWGKVRSQCESTGDRDKNNNLLYPQLAAEHTQLTKEIHQMILSSSEYQEFKEWWSEKYLGKPASEKNDKEKFQISKKENAQPPLNDINHLKNSHKRQLFSSSSLLFILAVFFLLISIIIVLKGKEKKKQ